MVKNLSAMQKTWVQSLGWEDPLEKGMATHSSILAWETLWTNKPGRLRFMGLCRVEYNRANNTFTFLNFIRVFCTSILILCVPIWQIFV